MRREWLATGVFAFALASDLLAKELVLANGFAVSNSWIWIGAHWNQGFMLGLMESLPIPHAWISVGVLVCIAIAAEVRRRAAAGAPELSAWMLFLAGGLANVVDRFLNDGAVLDWIQIKAGPLSTGRFNLADLFNLIGLFLIVYFLIKAELQQPERS